MKIKIIKSFILFMLTVIIGVLTLRGLSWLLLISSEGNFFAAAILFIIALVTVQALAIKLDIIKKYKDWIYSISFSGLFLLPIVAVSGYFGLLILFTPLILYIVKRKRNSRSIAITKALHTLSITSKEKALSKKVKTLKYLIDSKNSTVAIKYRGYFHLFSFYNIDLLLKIDVLENLLKSLFENDCNISSLELIKLGDKISVMLTLNAKNVNYFKALTQLEKEELLLSTILKANKIKYRRLEDPFNLELAYLGPVLFDDYFNNGIIKDYQLTQINFDDIEEIKKKLRGLREAHILFLIKKINKEIFEKEKQKILDELRESLDLKGENAVSTIALMTLISQEEIGEELGINNLKKRLHEINELEDRGLWYVNSFVFERQLEETQEGIPLQFILRKQLIKTTKDTHALSEGIQNAIIGLLNSLSLETPMKSPPRE